MGDKISQKSTGKGKGKGLKRHLGLFSVFAICTGAAFSSGFFLLPGMAADISGPSLPLAYLAAGILMLPAIFNIAELSSAMPRSGGPYFFITRSFGPLLGLIGVSGIYLMLLLKGAFAFVGVGVYLSILMEVPVQTVAIALIVLFTLINLMGVQQTAKAEVVMVIVLLIILSYFLVSGINEISAQEINLGDRFMPLFPFGWESFMVTISFVFISFGGVGQVASIAEEVKDPSTNIPKGMLIALAVSTFFYLVGTGIMVGLLSPDMLRENQTPAATAAEQINALPLPVLVIVVAALAAFASTGNAAILSASRFPLALSRDRLIWEKFGKLSKKGIPSYAVIVSGLLSIVLILLFNVREIAKIASAFLLFVFLSMCLAVLVFRESKSPEYKPKYRSPLYPWVQIIGCGVYILLLYESGVEALAFIGGIILIGLLWYYFGLKEKVNLSAAIYYLFGRLGSKGTKGTYSGGINLSSANLAPVIENAMFKDFKEEVDLQKVIQHAAEALADRVGGESENMVNAIKEEVSHWSGAVKFDISLAPVLLEGIKQPEMIILRGDIKLMNKNIKGMIVLVDDENHSDRMVKLMAQLENSMSHSKFSEIWEQADDAEKIKMTLIQDVQTLAVVMKDTGATAKMNGSRIRDIELPDHSLVAVVYRDGKMIVPDPDTEVKEGDEVIFIAQGEALEELKERFSENFVS